MAHRVIETVLKTMSSKRSNTYEKSNTENILLTNDALHSVAEVNTYQQELATKLLELGIKDTYHAWYLTSNYGKQADKILNKINFFTDTTIEDRLIRAELWYCIYNEMTNSLADFFVRRTGRLYFNIASVAKYKNLVLKDCINYLEWDEARVEQELNLLHVLLEDATHYYDKELA